MIDTLVVTIETDRTLKLNGLSDMGTVDDSAKLSAMLGIALRAAQTQSFLPRGDVDACRYP